MPPDPRDWLPEGHLAWTVLDAVAEMNLDAFYGTYPVDGHGVAIALPTKRLNQMTLQPTELQPTRADLPDSHRSSRQRAPSGRSGLLN